jgi:hypothetical protein
MQKVKYIILLINNAYWLQIKGKITSSESKEKSKLAKYKYEASDLFQPLIVLGSLKRMGPALILPYYI